MGKLLRGLHKLGLVELDEGERPMDPGSVDDLAAPAEETAASTTPADTGPPDLPPFVPEVPSQVAENRAFEDIYGEHRIPPSPYSAEKLVKVLEGLRAMQPEMRRTAVMAIDSADDSWAVEDAVLDAQRKIKALEAAKQGLLQAAQVAASQAHSDLEAREKQQQETITHIRGQISELEAMLAREVEGAARDKAEIQAAKRAAEEAGLRERMRLDAQIAVLQEIPRTFGDNDAATTP